MANEPILIKKYPNRRLYNTDTSAYITLDDLDSLIRSDYDVLVVDAKTGVDITYITLVHVILEHQEVGDKLLPINCLKQVIKLQGNKLSDVLTQYLSFSVDYFQKNQEIVENFVNSAIKDNSSANLWMQNLHFFQKQNDNFMKMMQSAMGLFGEIPEGLQPQDVQNGDKKQNSDEKK